MFHRLVADITIDINGLPLNKEWAIYVLEALGLHLSQDGHIDGWIVNQWRSYNATGTVEDLWRCCKGIWAHLRPSSRDHNLFILNAIKNCVQDPAYGLTDEDKKHLRVFENALIEFGVMFEKYEQMLFPRHTPSGRDDRGLHALLFQLQTGFISESDQTTKNL
jgi:hypothetical protein